MQVPTLANLIRLNDAAELDKIIFEEEAVSAFMEEDHSSPLELHAQKIDELIMEELKIPYIPSKFIEYNWYGYPDKLPWSRTHKIEFDPSLVSVIIPETGESLNIRGENRRIVLTFPPTYFGKKPAYQIVCSSERQIDNVRVLDTSIGRPFYGLENIFDHSGFDKLPKFKDVLGGGLFIVNKKEIIIPSTSTAYF